jgi:hypothetical protein
MSPSKDTAFHPQLGRGVGNPGARLMVGDIFSFYFNWKGCGGLPLMAIP